MAFAGDKKIMDALGRYDIYRKKGFGKKASLIKASKGLDKFRYFEFESWLMSNW